MCVRELADAELGLRGAAEAAAETWTRTGSGFRGVEARVPWEEEGEVAADGGEHRGWLVGLVVGWLAGER